jgi:hypothetical protein
MTVGTKKANELLFVALTRYYRWVRKTKDQPSCSAKGVDVDRKDDDPACKSSDLDVQHRPFRTRGWCHGRDAEHRIFGIGRILLVKEGVVMSLRPGMLETLACLAGNSIFKSYFCRDIHTDNSMQSVACAIIHTLPRHTIMPRLSLPNTLSIPHEIFAFEKSISGCCFWKLRKISSFFCSSLLGLPASFCL